MKEPWTIEVFVCGILFLLVCVRRSLDLILLLGGRRLYNQNNQNQLFYKHNNNTRTYMISFFEWWESDGTYRERRSMALKGCWSGSALVPLAKATGQFGCLPYHLI